MRKIVFFLCCIVLTSHVFAQEDNETDEIIDNLLGDDDFVTNVLSNSENIQLLYFSTEFNNKTYFSGRDIGVDQFNINPQLLYIHSSGFFGGLSSIYYSEFNPNWDFISTTFGYGNNFGKEKKHRWSAFYARYFYGSGVDNPFTNALSVAISTTNSSKNFGGELSSTYLFGSDTSIQFTASSFVELELLKNKNITIKARPQVAFLVGNQAYEIERVIGINNQVTIYSQFNEFGFLNSQINIPLQFEFSDVDIEAGFNINFPSAIGNETSLKTTYFFNLSVGYTLDLN